MCTLSLSMLNPLCSLFTLLAALSIYLSVSVCLSVCLSICLSIYLCFGRSYSWSTNVCGRKRWLLFPPGDEKAFLSRFGSFPLDVTSDELADRVQYPMASSAKAPIVVIQEAGQTIFVPRCVAKCDMNCSVL